MSKFKHSSSIMLIRTSEDAANVFLRKDPRTSKSGRSYEDFRRFLRHEHGSFDGIRRSSEGDNAMIFEQNYARREAHLVHVRHCLLSDYLREFQPGIRIGNECRRRPAADDIVGEKFHRS